MRIALRVYGQPDLVIFQMTTEDLMAGNVEESLALPLGDHIAHALIRAHCDCVKRNGEEPPVLLVEP